MGRFDEEQEGAKSQEEEEIVANLCFMVDIVSNEETELEHSYEELQKAYDELLYDSRMLSSHYTFLK